MSKSDLIFLGKERASRSLSLDLHRLLLERKLLGSIRFPMKPMPGDFWRSTREFGSTAVTRCLWCLGGGRGFEGLSPTG